MDLNDVEQVRQFIVEKNATHSPEDWREFLKEEWEEFQNAFDAGDLIGILDAICDINYELNGLGIVMGMDIVGARNEVHRSNMTKDKGDGTHKIRKGPGRYSPPVLSPFITREHAALPLELTNWFIDREAEQAEVAKWSADNVVTDGPV
jgi:hypothetical protein